MAELQDGTWCPLASPALVCDEGTGTVDDPWFHIEVELVGQNGNTAHLAGCVAEAMKLHGVSALAISQFREMVYSSSSYDEALQVMMRWVDVS